MSDQEQNGGLRGGRPRQDDPRRAGERDRPWAGRSSDERGRFSSDEERYGPGSRSRSEEDYGGQAYGLEGGRDHEMRQEPPSRRAWDDEERETWRPGDGGPYGDLELNPRNHGIQEFGAPHDYAYHPHAGHELDPDDSHPHSGHERQGSRGKGRRS